VVPRSFSQSHEDFSGPANLLGVYDERSGVLEFFSTIFREWSNYRKKYKLEMW